LQHKTQQIAIVVGTIAIMGVAIYAVLFAIASMGDRHQREVEQTIVHSAFAQIRDRLSDGLIQNAYWDTAYDNVTDHPDPAWVKRYLDPYTSRREVWAVDVIVNAQAKPVYIERSGTQPAIGAAVLRAMHPLLVRALGSPPLPVKPATAFVAAGNDLYLATAMRIIPDDEARLRRPLGRRFVLAYLLPIDSGQLRALESRFHIAPIRRRTAPVAERAQVALEDVTGVPVAYLQWHAARPGLDFANAAAPFAIGCFAILGILQLMILRSWMRAAERLRDEGIARTMFLANVSHELRTPLNAIIGFSECMAFEMFGPMPPQYREYSDDIRKSGQHLLGIVNDVLDLTELNSTEAVSTHAVCLAEALSDPLRILREYAKPDGVTIAFQDMSAGAEVIAYEKAISQIVLNLGSNAVKFSPPGGAVDIVIQPAARSDSAELVVRDRGAGIPADKLRLVGQPFFQAHNATARKPGSGLGLAIVKSLAERLGGELTIESILGVGTTAVVRLPLCPRAVSPADWESAVSEQRVGA
jgi:signal transduction histidine kinase